MKSENIGNSTQNTRGLGSYLGLRRERSRCSCGQPQAPVARVSRGIRGSRANSGCENKRQEFARVPLGLVPRLRTHLWWGLGDPLHLVGVGKTREEWARWGDKEVIIGRASQSALTADDIPHCP